MSSSLENRFCLLWEQLGDGTIPQREYPFAADLTFTDKAGRTRKRGWRFDFAFPDERIAIEIEGGIFVRGRHSRGRGAVGDADKYNHAALTGWLLLRYTVVHLDERPAEMVEQVKQALAVRRVNRQNA